MHHLSDSVCTQAFREQGLALTERRLPNLHLQTRKQKLGQALPRGSQQVVCFLEVRVIEHSPAGVRGCSSHQSADYVYLMGLGPSRLKSASENSYM